MEEREKLKKKANPNSENSSKNNNNNKEEGELSASSDDHNNNEIRDGSATRYDGSRTVAQKEHARVASVQKSVQFVKNANPVLTSNRSRVVGATSRSFVQPMYHKKFEKNRVPFVISFSDDSGSDSEEYVQRNTYESKSFAGVSGRQPATSFAKSQILRANSRKGTMVPRKVSSHTFVSSINKDNIAFSRNKNSLLGDKRSHVKQTNAFDKNRVDQDHGCNQNVHPNSSKLQYLRQLIAIRENELKINAAKKNKEPASGSYRTDSAINLNNRATTIDREVQVDFSHLELKEADKKRLKVSESHSCKANSDGRKDNVTAETMLSSEKSLFEHCSTPIVENCSWHGEETAPGRTQWQTEEENRACVLASNLPRLVKEGNTVIPNSNHCNRSVKFADSSARVENRHLETCPKTSIGCQYFLFCNHKNSGTNSICVPLSSFLLDGAKQ